MALKSEAPDNKCDVQVSRPTAAAGPRMDAQKDARVDRSADGV